MAKFTSKYLSLGFYANGELKRFSNGIYVTEDKDEITILAGMRDVKIEKEEPKATVTKTEAKPATKPTTRRASAK